MHTFGELKLKSLPQKYVLYDVQNRPLGTSQERYPPGITLGPL